MKTGVKNYVKIFTKTLDHSDTKCYIYIVKRITKKKDAHLKINKIERRCLMC